MKILPSLICCDKVESPAVELFFFPLHLRSLCLELQLCLARLETRHSKKRGESRARTKDKCNHSNTPNDHMTATSSTTRHPHRPLAAGP
ncbi:hypothetical protein J6590_097987 [Homalodisca vitripennis]|nr:hypothetical protein J6590_097987 [Homalodisca vitripennis]